MHLPSASTHLPRLPVTQHCSSLRHVNHLTCAMSSCSLSGMRCCCHKLNSAATPYDWSYTVIT